MANIISSLRLTCAHALSRVLHVYADYRIGATEAEKHCYKKSDSILLTFDDYGSPEEVSEILTILREKNVKAMFFLQGDWIEAQPEQLGAIQKAGHACGNHTYSHIVLKGESEPAIVKEISNGLPGPWLRPPQGRYDKRVRAIAAKLGYVMCYWTIDSRDWTGASVADMHHTIMSELHPGAVILFHLHGTHTRALLPQLIDDIRTAGFTLTSPDETWSAPIAHKEAA